MNTFEGANFENEHTQAPLIPNCTYGDYERMYDTWTWKIRIFRLSLTSLFLSRSLCCTSCHPPPRGVYNTFANVIVRSNPPDTCARAVSECFIHVHKFVFCYTYARFTWKPLSSSEVAFESFVVIEIHSYIRMCVCVCVCANHACI
jgi:hypothetical protein